MLRYPCFLALTCAKLPFQSSKCGKSCSALAWQFSAHWQLPAPFRCTHVSTGRLQPRSRGRALCPAHTLPRAALVLDTQRIQDIYPAFAALPACHLGAGVWQRCPRELAEGNHTLAEKGGRNLAGFIADAPGRSLEILVCKSSLHSSSHPIYCSPFTHVSKAL